MSIQKALQIMLIDTAGFDYGIAVKDVLNSTLHSSKKLKIISKVWGDFFTLEYNHKGVASRIEIVATSSDDLDGPVMKLRMASFDAFVLVHSSQEPESFDILQETWKRIVQERPTGLNVPVFIIHNNIVGDATKSVRRFDPLTIGVGAHRRATHHLYRDVNMKNIRQLRRLFKEAVHECELAHGTKFSTLLQTKKTLFSILKLCKCTPLD